jgi:hypothetical protein
LNQSSYIAAFLLAGFVLWLAANNRLVAYADVLWGSPKVASGPAPQSNAPAPNVPGGPAPSGSDGRSASDPVGAVDLGSVVQKAIPLLQTIGGFFGL